MKTGYINGYLDTETGKIPAVSAEWSFHDSLGSVRVRSGIRRAEYRVKPGVYAVGRPDGNSRVFVTANYKLSFDHLRRVLAGRDGWILVLDTKGINVWCAAGKKTFGTKELVKRIREHGLEKLVTHRKLILPQLGAVGVAAHEVREQTGFSVIYGPVRAADLPEFLDSGLKAAPRMRNITFTLKERLLLIPNDLLYAGYYLLLVPAAFLLVSGLNSKGYSVDRAVTNGGKAILNLMVAYLAGLALTPALLPWIPFRRFALKGLALGWLAAAALLLAGTLGPTVWENIAWFLMMGSVASFCAMSFTGTSTFTSLSGVQKEMKEVLPFQIGSAGIGLIGFIVTRFITP
jgi:hypothetical protein